MKLSIVIPIFNEMKTLAEIVRQVQAVPYPVDHEIIIIDDGSTDGTYAKAAEVRAEYLRAGKEVQLFRNEFNRGKSFSIRKGIRYAQGDFLIIQDGDMEYDPTDIPALLEPLLNGRTDVVCGSRFLKTRHPEAMTILSRLANKTLTELTNFLYGLQLTDMEGGYKVFRTSLLKELDLHSERFEFEPEVIALLAKRGVHFLELPIGYHARTVKEGKKINGMDFVEAVWTLIKHRFGSRP